MEAKICLIEPLLEEVEAYSKTSIELLKLKSIDKVADVSATLIARIIFSAVLALFIITLNIAVALWLGSLLGKNYYGFFVVSSIYAIGGIVLFFAHPIIKAHVNNVIITQLLN